ncbi:hypothetical protein BBI17_003661 [Phytophthora kernoviae]|uniref:Uncharacterized protein n=2 Tax=Phytophthora kernoviae TaxID=325452 RepID=A0A421EWW0_9STRA|nr:hypothetical protein G195_007292 [Phytophthora kernoviae 00238/432]KAG2528522.1 hypothetical protein JM16_002741 [Phytophthora kernoviae]KAG2529154.1 hypothetical protein JM18_002915 [Phytophthora kernoviae]RLN06459.1 hypothetical protein BBI17_003661 [Phytophthora kernoviae]
MRVKSAYEQGNITDGAVLASIITPSTSDPFRSLTIKWVEQGGPTLDHHRYHPLHYPVTLPGASSREDLIFLEATGVTTLASGERVGYQLRHSVHFPQTHVRPNKTVVTCVTAPRRDERIGTHVVQREVTLCNVCVHHSMVATSSQHVAREEIESDPKRWKFPSPTRDRDRISEGYLDSHFSTSSMRGAGALRPIPIPAMSMRSMSDLFQPCA